MIIAKREAGHAPTIDCDCGPCARAERDRLRAELASVRALTVCGCGDEFTAHDPGKCGNCAAADSASLRAELASDNERFAWLESRIFEGKWDGTIGRPKYWGMAGPYRHELVKMNGNTLREAIDKARAK